MENNNQPLKLKPVVYTSSYFKKGAPDTVQQTLLLKALQVTSDPRELRRMLGVRTVAEVYRTLDKLAIRKEYHEALAKHGVSLDFVVEGLKNVAQNGEKDADRLKAYQVILKSVGLEKYDSSEEGRGKGTWEETLINTINTEKEAAEKLSPPSLTSLPASTSSQADDDIEDYEVTQPIVPERIKKMQSEEQASARSIYD